MLKCNFRSSKRHWVHWRVQECCTVFMQDRVQCVLPQIDVQEWCIVFRVVHGAQYTVHTCRSVHCFTLLVQELCTVCMRVLCLAGVAEEECGMHWLAGAEQASV